MGDSVIGRLQAALTAATNEVTVAAANINFDFTLVKYEAPKEYQPLGALLSSKRKHDAENGKSHVTARRLAALFEGLCPDTPNLIRAYGDRVSHISKLATDGIAKAYTQSVFAAFTGVDATSIWAAATSTQGSKGGAIHVHLLACMLATMWDAPEAISIWSEVITGRRQQVASDLENGVALPFSMAAAAAQQDIPRSQLAEWDSSARAWIQTADNIMLKQQTQLKLILKNVDLNIPKSSGVYQSVVRTWHAALSAMENLISGIPQEVQDGVALLALSAWHIYPDIDVFGSKNVKVKMDDSLVSLGGVLSIGCNQAATTSAKGVTWALSLSHLRYYGNPVRKLAQLHDNPANLSYSEFRQAVLGCVLQIWGVRKAEEDQVLDDLYRISKPFSSRTQIDAKLRNAMSFLHEAIHDFRADRDTGCRLLDLGRKRPNFIEPKNRTEMGNVTFKQCFGLFETKSFISMLDGDEARIAYLRRIVGRYLSLEHEAIIAIRYGNIRFDSEKNRKGTNYSDDVAVSSRESSTKLDAADRDVSHGHDPSNGMNQVPFFATGLSQHLEQSTGQQQARGTHTRWYRHRVSQRKGPSGLGGQRERILLNEENKIFRPVTQTKFTRIMNGRPRPYRYLLGHLEFGAIFIPENIHSTTVSQLPDIATSVEDILWAVQFDKLCIYRHHARDLDAIQDCIMSSLAYLEEALGVFRTLPGRMIKAQILRGSIEKRHWRQYCQKTLTGAHGFRDKSEYQRTAWQMCVVSYFFAERDIHPEVIPSNAMGISAGDSIFVPNKLLEDPLDAVPPTYLVRILGNLGIPGCVIFSLVTSPMMPPVDESEWRVQNEITFNGRAENALHGTSLHLSFTDWQRSLDDIAERGNRDAQFLTMEAVVSIRDKGTWMGDVDAVKGLTSNIIRRMPPQPPCSHPEGSPPVIPMVSIEDWKSLRDLPYLRDFSVVVRAHGNWLARLAVAAFLVQCAEHPGTPVNVITICPLSMCWACVKHKGWHYVYIY